MNERDDTGALADHLDAAARAAPTSRAQAQPDQPTRRVFVQATAAGQRVIIAEADTPGAAQRSGAWLAAHEPVEVRR